MMKHMLYCFVMLLMVFSCQSIDEASKPKTVIEEDRMVEILTDIAIIKAAKSSNRKVFQEEKINPEAYILKKHGVDSIVFTENHIWYSGQIEKYKEIFTRVKSNLDKSKADYEKLKKEEDSIKKIEDSIKRVQDTLKNKEKLIAPGSEISKEIEKAKKKRFKNPSEKE